MLIPRGEGDCRIPFNASGNEVRIGVVPASCAYYCGPGVTLAGKSFSKDGAPQPVTDFAGDSLC